MTARPTGAAPCRDCGATDAASTCWGCAQRALATDGLRPSLLDRLGAAKLYPARRGGPTSSWRARCPACIAAGRRVSASLRVTATPAGLLVSCERGCPQPTIMRALDALDGWGTAP